MLSDNPAHRCLRGAFLPNIADKTCFKTFYAALSHFYAALSHIYAALSHFSYYHAQHIQIILERVF